MGREKTVFRHVNSQGEKVRVTKENDNFYIGNSNDRAEGKMSHHRSAGNFQRSDHNINNPFYGRGNGEWDDYAHTSDDL